MRRALALILCLTCLFAATSLTISAATTTLPVLRAGGGGGGGGGGFSTRGRHRFDPSSPLDWIILIGRIVAIIVSVGASIAFYLRCAKLKHNTKKLMGMLERKDNAWKYLNLQKNVRAAYFAIQNAWTNLDMTPAREYMAEALFEEFQDKLRDMKKHQERNVLQSIRLLDAIPIALYDSSDDRQDFVWILIKGKMADYTVDSERGVIIKGDKKPFRFCEYWQFVRKEGKHWALNKILQQQEGDEFPFKNHIQMQ